MSISNIDKIREKVEKLKKLADAMYYAAQYLTTDASRLHKAMDDYHQFIIYQYYKEEPASDELEKVVEEIVDPTVLNAYGVKDIANRLRRTMIERVSEELEKVSKEWLAPQLDKSYAGYGEAKMMELTRFDGYAMLDAIEFGAKWKGKNLWKPADGEDLPEYEREVVVFTQNFPNDAGIMMVAIAHRPDPKGWDGKSITTGKVEHYTPKTYDKSGWNIPDVKYWLDVELPKEIEL